ncbi:MAG: 2-oxo-4-hydroxy-4-carboxy-5-ureidoimidazoline decarboxylase [Synechococcales bacterium]|nr:2-oxo-4-hydroxy-4-carboxy-5-ureidoimidazoline decarboxylase [Synechococcales bacterium]
MNYSLSQLNQMPQAEFTAALGDVFEQTPAIAHATWHQRPFASLEELHQAMVQVLHTLSPEEQLALIQAHPELGSKARMADASVAEQAGAGLNCLRAEVYERFQSLNQRYRAAFGFPFIIAVKHHTQDSILAAFEQRLTHSPQEERRQALAEIAQIAWLRLVDWVAD